METLTVKKYSIAMMGAKNEAIGHYWFGKDEMKSFGTKIAAHPNKWNLFITSETCSILGTKYTVRIFSENGKVQTVGPFHKMSLAEAKKFRGHISKAFDQAGNREIHVLNNLAWVDLEYGVCKFVADDNKAFEVNCTNNPDPNRLICG